MTCPNCRGETHLGAGRLVCSAGCGWSQDEATPATCTCGPRASHAVRCERCGLPPGVPEPAAPRVEPRRPQVGDEVEVRQWGSREDWRKVTVQSVKVTPALTRVSVDGGDSYLHEAPDDAPTRSPGKTYGWRWPATQGAAVAGPAQCSCSHLQVEHRRDGICVNHLRCLCDGWSPRTFTPPPASEPPRSYSPSCAGTCWPPCAHHGVEVALFMYKDRTRVLVQLAEVTAAKAALEAARDNAVRERDEARADRTRALALATEHLEAKAALEVQLAEALKACPRCVAGVCSAHQPLEGQLGNVRDELVETQEALANMTEERDMQQFHARDVAAERDALAAQLKAARETLIDVTDRLESASAVLEHEGLWRGHDARHTAAGDVEAIARARAALAASGPVKEGE